MLRNIILPRTCLKKMIPSMFSIFSNTYSFATEDKKTMSYPQKQGVGQSEKINKPNLINKQGIFIDEQSIKAKMKEIKQRGEVSSQKQKKQDPEFMKNYQINKESSKVKKFRKDTDTENLMLFEDVSLDQKPTVVQVTSYSNTQIQVDGFAYPPSIILTPNQVLLWQVNQMKEVKVQHLKLLQLINPPPQYIIIGCTKVNQVSQDVRKYLSQLGINYDINEMFEAVSNFNTFAVDEVRIMGFFISSQQSPA